MIRQSESTSSSHRVVIRALLVLAVLPNLLLSFAAISAHAPRALVNLDYLVVLALDGFLSRATIVTLMTLVVLIDVAFTMAPAFHFGPTEVVQAVAEIRHFSGRTIAIALAAIVLVTLIAIAIVLLRGRRYGARDRMRLLAAGSAFALTAVAADIINGSNAVAWRLRPLLKADLSASMFASRYAAPGTLAPTGKITAETDGVREEIAKATGNGRWDGPNKIVIVMVEAMGAPRGARASALFAPLITDSIARRFETRTGTIPAFGSTTTGELRALCGVAMNHLAALGADLHCLPQQLRALGFEAVALHGYNGSLFQRRDWYPRVGFTRMRFREELQVNRDYPECGIVFHGVCDSSMITVLRDELTRAPEKRELIYWLSLSSHFPIDPRTRSSGAACDALGRIGRERDVCALWNTLWPVLQGIARLAADPAVPPAWYIVAGDHAPPQLFSDTTMFLQRRVPFIELRPISR